MMPDGKSIAFDGSQPRRIHVVNIEEGALRAITSDQSDGPRPHTLAALAPDGKSVFYNSRDRRTFSLSIDTKEAHEFLPQVKAASLRLGGFSWLPDSRFVVFQAKNKIWAIAPPDGQPAEIASLPTDLAEYSMSAPRCSPDGKLITFGVDSENVEYWAIENFLPQEKLAGK